MDNQSNALDVEHAKELYVTYYINPPPLEQQADFAAAVKLLGLDRAPQFHTWECALCGTRHGWRRGREGEPAYVETGLPCGCGK